MYRVFRVIVNSFAFVLTIVMSVVTFQYNPLLSIVFFLASLDQLEDVYYYIYGKRLIPRSLMFIDIVFEGVMFMVGLAMLLLSVSYYAYFSTWFFRALLFLSVMVMWSSVEDVLQWVSAPATPTAPGTQAPSIPMKVFTYVREKKEVCETQGRYVRRKSC
ncbi:MAG: hypothetical protein LM568_03565 [Desulfurococcaceae archaeon]|nr:hypothetical protein [Desulfurococcaceae archaeon]